MRQEECQVEVYCSTKGDRIRLTQSSKDAESEQCVQNIYLTLDELSSLEMLLFDAQRQLLRWFAINMREKRLERGLSQRALSTLSGINRTYLGNVERGRRDLLTLHVPKIAKALNVDPQELFTKPNGYLTN